MTRNLIPFAVLLTLLCSVQSAVSTTSVRMDLEDLVRTSGEIVHGTVAETACRWTEDHTMIVTDVVIDVHRSIAGDAVGQIAFVHPGGVVGALRVAIPGAGAFKVGQEAVLFLSRDENGVRRVTGLIQGRFDVEPG